MFKKVLIANRSEVALRIERTCRRLGIRTVAVYSEADRSAPHVAEADEAVLLGPAPLPASYLNQAALLEALHSTGADAVHPGYGLLSENASFAQAVSASGAKWIGPDAAALHVFGDKLQARSLASSVGVAPPPGSSSPVHPGDTAALEAQAARIGLPVVVKAAGGGGGIGIAAVRSVSELSAAAQRCSERGKAAFGDDRIYLERYLEGPRHIEVQVLVDRQGTVWTLGERECSVQRRHQKLVEECPSPAPQLAPGARFALHAAAARVMGARPYEGLATVEFIMDRGGELFFLEVNPRLQVEHGVTEMVYGVDLVELQLRLAAGHSLPQAPPAPAGHAFEVRLYAEDPRRNFAPQPGVLKEVQWPAPAPHLRVETAVSAGSEVTAHYDPLLAKLLCHGPDRQTALTRLREALAATRLELVGKTAARRTNLDYLRELIDLPEVACGDYTTELTESHPESPLRAAT